jgi:hypothetical protein
MEWEKLAWQTGWLLAPHNASGGKRKRGKPLRLKDLGISPPRLFFLEGLLGKPAGTEPTLSLENDLERFVDAESHDAPDKAEREAKVAKLRELRAKARASRGEAA